MFRFMALATVNSWPVFRRSFLRPYVGRGGTLSALPHSLTIYVGQEKRKRESKRE